MNYTSNSAHNNWHSQFITWTKKQLLYNSITAYDILPFKPSGKTNNLKIQSSNICMKYTHKHKNTTILYISVHKENEL